MIQDKNTNYVVSGNVTGDKIAMGIDPAAMAHIMGVLTDLYSDPMLAIIREYSTNARDAHVEAGTSRPIEVTTPSQLSPFFTVQDFGVGLAHDDIRAIYSQYGASTKRNTNDQVGMLGLGCKSALTYSNQFTLVGVKNGVRVTVVIGRDDDGAGSMTVVDTATTHEPNGVTIRVPAKLTDAQEFERKAQQFFSFWEPGTVLVNGQQPKPLAGLKVSDNFTIIDGHKSYAIMGNVAYPVEGSKLNHGMGYNTSLVVRVPIGSLHFTPSREALHYTPKTEATLREAAKDFQFHVKGAIQRLVDEADSYQDALDVVQTWSQRLPTAARAADYTYKGHTMPKQIKHIGMVMSNRGSSLGSHTTTGTVNAQVFSDTLFITGYDRETYTAGQKKKMLHYIENTDGLGTIRVFCLLRPDHPLTRDEKRWLKPQNIVPWATINAIKLTPKAGQRTAQYRVSGSFDCFRGGQAAYEVPAQEVYNTPKDRLYFYNGNLGETRRYATALMAVEPDALIVALPTNRKGKFTRELPHAKEVSTLIRERYNDWLKTVPANLRRAWAAQMSHGASDLKRLDASRVNDPAIQAAIRDVKTDLSALSKQAEKWNVVVNVNTTLPTKDYTNPLNRYPLFDLPATWYKGRDDFKLSFEHNYLYLNAAYAAYQAEELAKGQQSDKAA